MELIQEKEAEERKEKERIEQQQNYNKEELHLPQNPFGNTYKELQQELNKRRDKKEIIDLLSGKVNNPMKTFTNLTNNFLSNNFEKILNDDYSMNYYRFIENDNEADNNFYGIDTINKDGKIFSKEMPNLQLTEDKDNIIITDINTNQTYKQSKQWQTKETTMKDLYTNEELKQIKQERIDWNNMSDEEWNKYINKKRTYNHKLSNFQAQKIKKAMEPFSEEQINNIKSMEPVGLEDYIMATREQEMLKDIREQAVLHYKEGKELTEEELYSLQSYAIYNANINLRGISFLGKLMPGVMTNLGVNAEASLSSVITDLGTNLLLAPIGGKILNNKITQSGLKYVLGTGKAYKTAKFVGKYLALPLAKGTTDYLLKTTIIDKLNLPFGSGSIEEQYRDKRLNKILEFTDKGTLTLKQLTNDDEEFLKTQTNKEAFIEAYTERALDPFFNLLGGLADNRIKNGSRNWWWRTLKLGKKINDLPRIAGTTFDGLLGEHSEELLGITLQYLMKANDKDSTLYQSLKEYGKLENFTLSTLNIWIAGGLFRQMTNAITGNKNNQQTEPISDSIIREHLKKKGVSDNYIKAKLDILKPEQKDNLAQRIVLKEDRDSEKKYQERLNKLMESVKEQYGEEDTKRFKAIFNAFTFGQAYNFGVSREDIINNLSLTINSNVDYEEWEREREERKRINEEIRLEQASYKNSRTNIKDFVNFINSNEYKENNKQTYQDFNIGNNTNLRLMNNTIEHTNKHNLTSEDYENLLNNINNIKEIKYSNVSNQYGNNNLILDIETPKGEMGVVLTIGNNNNYITTAFYKSNTNLWNEWWNKEDNKLLGAGENTANSQDNLLSNIIIDYRKNNVKNNNYNQSPQYTKDTININGKERTVYNSNNERIADTEEELRNFYNWFGDSKVVDDKGKPLKTTHYSKEKFNIFDIEKAGQNNFESSVGFWFADTDEFAFKEEGKEKYSTYLKMENPYYFSYNDDADSYQEFLTFIDELEDLYKQENYIEEDEEIDYKDFRDYIRNHFIKNGYDGIIIEDTIMDAKSPQEKEDIYNGNYEEYDEDGNLKGDKTINQYIVFNPNQIKSINNKGTYNINDNNIYNQTDNNTEPKLIMGTATSINNLDSIIKNNGLISPSFSITTINNEYLKENNFGDIFFIRNPQYINYKEDNIYDRDIWSPRQNIYNDLYYEVKGILNPISNYDMENIKRFINENNIEAIKRNYSLDDADIKNIIDGNYKEKLFMGFNERTGDRIYKDLNNKTLLQNYKQQLKESPFLGGERYNDNEPATSLEHLLSFYSNKQKNKKELKKTGKEYLTNDRKESNKKYGEYELEYEDILNKIEEELGYTPSYETLTNLYDYGFLEEKEEFDEDLIKEFKDFIDEALKLPRDYFEAKPIKEIPLNEFSYIVAPKNKINEKQKQQLESKGITIKEYENKEDKTNILNELYKEDGERVYFQKQNINNNNNNINNNNVLDLTEEFKELNNITNGFEINNLLKDIIENLRGEEFKTKDNNIIKIDNNPIRNKKGDDHIVNKAKGKNQETRKIIISITQKLKEAISEAIEDKTRNGEITEETLKHNSQETQEYKKNNFNKFFYFNIPVKIDNNNIKGILTTVSYKENNKENKETDKKFLYEISIEPQGMIQGAQDNYNSNLSNSQVNSLQNQNQPTIKGNILFNRDSTEAVINLFKNKADQSTLLHETVHYFTESLKSYAKKGYPMAQTMLDEIKEWTATYNIDNLKSIQTMHERVSRGFEQYLRSGKYDNPILKNTYDYFREFLLNIYKNAEDLNIDVNNPQMFKFFDKYVFAPENYINDSDWVYYMGDDDDKDKEEKEDNNKELNKEQEDQLNIINNSNSLTELTLLNQGTEKEELNKAIDIRIKFLQRQGYNEDQMKKDFVLQNLVKSYTEIIKKAVDNMEETSIEDIKQIEVIDNKDKEENKEETKEDKETKTNETKEKENKEETNKKEEEKVKSSISQSKYKQERMNKYIESYNKSLINIYDNNKVENEYNKQLNILNEYYELKNNTNNKEENKQEENNNNNTNEIENIKNNLNKFIDKIFSKEIQEETEYVNKIFREKNEIRRQIEEQSKYEGVDYGIHPYKNIQEMLNDFEKAYNNLTYRQKKRKSDLLSKEESQGQSVNDYTLSYEEYDKIVNFRKKYLKEQINKLNDNINKQNKDILNLQMKLDIEKETNQTNRDLIMKYQNQIKDFENLSTKLGANINTINEVEEAMGIIKDSTLRDKILKYSSGGHSAEYVKKKIDEYKDKEFKKDYQKMIDNILLSTISISKRTGRIYGETIYEDDGFFKELKAINKYSKRKAEEELLKLESERAEGTNTESQKHYDLKRQLLYFKSTDKIETKFMEEILNNLGDFTRESKELQNKIKTDNLYSTVMEKKRIKELIDKTKTTADNNLLGTVSHFGNLKTILEFIGGKEMAKKMDMLPNEMLYMNSIKQKQDDIFNKIFDIVGEDNIKKVFKEFSQPVTEVQYKRSKEDIYNRTYNTIELKTSMEELKLKIRRAIENMEDWNGGWLIGILNSINPSFQGGNRTYYKYRISNGDVENLLNIINHIQYYSDNNKDLEDIEKTLNKIETKEYKTDIEDYEIDLWGVMQYDLQRRNETTKKLIERYYTKETIDRLEEIINNSPKEFKEIEDILFEAVQDREELNPYYVMEFNRDMGRVSNYFPRRSLHENEINLFDTLTTTEKEKNKKVSAIENRSYNAIPNFNVNPLSLAMNHIQQTEYIKNIAVKLKNISNIFDTSIKDYITEKKGKDITNALVEHLDNLKNTIPTPSTDTEKLIGYFVGNWANSVTNTPSVLLKQATSFVPYMEGLNPLKFIKNYVKGILSFNETKNFMKKMSPYINYRLEKNKYKDIFDIIKKEDISSSKKFIDLLKKIPDTKDKILNKTLGKIPILNKLTQNSLVEIGDIISVIYGGYARYKTNIENGMSEIEAIADFERQTAETQQSDFKSLQARETAKNNNFFSRIARMFSSQQGQYYNKKLQRDIERINKEISTKDRINNIILYNLVIPFLSTLMSSLIIPKLYGKRKKDIKEMFKDYVWAILMSRLGLDLIKQTGILALKEEGFDLIKNHLTNIQGAITGMPIDIFKIMFNRPYEADLYDSEKEKKNKAKRIRREERRRNK